LRTIQSLKNVGNAKTIDEIVKTIEISAENEKKQLKELYNEACQDQSKVIVIVKRRRTLWRI